MTGHRGEKMFAHKRARPKSKDAFLGYIELLRPFNCVMAAIAAAIGFFLAAGTSTVSLAVAMASAFLICGAGQAINDAMDAKIDALVSKKRPIPSGKVKRKNALMFSIILFAAGVLLASALGALGFAIAGAFALLLIIYPVFLDRAKYLGNFVVALGTAFTLVFGAAAAGTVPWVVVFFAASAFLANMGREVTKDFEDLRKDRGHKRTLPMIFPRFAKMLVMAYYFFAVVLAIAAYCVFGLNPLYLIFVSVSAAVLACAFYFLSAGRHKASQRYSKWGMLASLLAYIAAMLK